MAASRKSTRRRGAALLDRMTGEGQVGTIGVGRGLFGRLWREHELAAGMALTREAVDQGDPEAMRRWIGFCGFPRRGRG